MKHQDQYGNPITTAHSAAADAYREGVRCFLSARSGVETSLLQAIEVDPDFAMAHLVMARHAQVLADRTSLNRHLEQAGELASGATDQERSLIAAMSLLLTGKAPAAYTALRQHLQHYPGDAMAAQTCVGVFGLIGFSGKRGREAEQLAFTSHYLPFYKNDPWFLGQHAFSQCEVGQLESALDNIETALADDPGSAHNAHVHSHIRYEGGETETGYRFLADWWQAHPCDGILSCHISWHMGIWAIELNDSETMWKFIDKHVNPDNAAGPPINILTDYVAFLFRLFFAGHKVPQERWQVASNYAQTHFPKPGLAFVDVHAAVAHQMAGRNDLILELMTGAKGPAKDLAGSICAAFYAIAHTDFRKAEELLRPRLSDSERIGGSRAQRDLLDYAYVHCLRQQGRTQEAKAVVELRRPHISHALYTF